MGEGLVLEATVSVVPLAATLVVAVGAEEAVLATATEVVAVAVAVVARAATESVPSGF